MKKIRGLFITFEGVEGSGKSTQARRLTRWLHRQNHDCLLTREPGGLKETRPLRRVLLDANQQATPTPAAELLLYCADRALHVEHCIRPALLAGRTVLCDRYIDSTTAYQSYGRRIDRALVDKLHGLSTKGLCPDLTLLFDLPVEEGLARSMKRLKKEGKSLREGRFEKETLAFHRRVRKGFLELADAGPRRFVVLDASRSPNTIAVELRDLLRNRFSRRLSL